MSRHNGGSYSTLRCDIPGCEHRFITFSFVRFLRRQGQANGWRRVSGRKISGGEPGLILSLKMVDVCPTCRPEPYEKLPNPPKEPRKRTRKTKQAETSP